METQSDRRPAGDAAHVRCSACQISNHSSVEQRLRLSPPQALRRESSAVAGVSLLSWRKSVSKESGNAGTRGTPKPFFADYSRFLRARTTAVHTWYQIRVYQVYDRLQPVSVFPKQRGPPVLRPKEAALPAVGSSRNGVEATGARKSPSRVVGTTAAAAPATAEAAGYSQPVDKFPRRVRQEHRRNCHRSTRPSILPRLFPQRGRSPAATVDPAAPRRGHQGHGPSIARGRSTQKQFSRDATEWCHPDAGLRCA